MSNGAFFVCFINFFTSFHVLAQGEQKKKITIMIQRILYSVLVVEMSPNNNIVTNPKQNWWWLTVSSKSVAANISIQYTRAV